MSEDGNIIKFTGQDAIDAFNILRGNSGSDSNESNESDESDESDEDSDGCCGTISFGSYYLNTTQKEEVWFNKNPEKAEFIKGAAFSAGFAATIASGSAGGGNDGYGDAFRHSYWMYLIAKEFGAEVAKEYGDLHEDIVFIKNGQKQNNKRGPQGIMDTNNNYWGINYANMKDNSILNFKYDFNTAVINKKIIIINRQTIPKRATQKGRDIIQMRNLISSAAMAKYERFGE